jgi:hypothetical protein
MTIHYHGTPITPYPALLELRGKHFCVSYAAPQDIETVHRIGQSVMLDNGAYSLWKKGKAKPDWNAYYKWCEPWLNYATTWAVIPDSIDGSEADNNRLLNEWPFRINKGAPVWHIHESHERLQSLLNEYPRICFGSSGEYAEIGTKQWHTRMATTFDYIYNSYEPQELPAIHMLRGMSLAGSRYPFTSLDSTDVGHHRKQNAPGTMAKDWDSMQCPALWTIRERMKR